MKKTPVCYFVHYILVGRNYATGFSLSFPKSSEIENRKRKNAILKKKGVLSFLGKEGTVQTLDHGVFTVLVKGAMNVYPIQSDHSIGGSAGAGIHDPKTAFQLLAIGNMGVTKQKNIGPAGMGIGDSGLITPLYPPEMAVGKENLFTA